MTNKLESAIYIDYARLLKDRSRYLRRASHLLMSIDAFKDGVLNALFCIQLPLAAFPDKWNKPIVTIRAKVVVFQVYKRI